MRILNLHGFMGEADNKNYKALCKKFPANDIISPKLNYMETSPEKLLEHLSDMVDTDDFIFVGQSLGGWYADKLSRKFKRPCILTNPCYYPYKLELITSSGIPEDFVEQYSRMSSFDKNESAYTLCSEADTMSLMEELFTPNSYQHHYSYPVIVTPSQNGYILNTVDFEDLSVEADNIQYGIGYIRSAIAQRKISSVLPEPTPASELALGQSDFVVMATV